jgi:hypothetical protein
MAGDAPAAASPALPSSSQPRPTTSNTGLLPGAGGADL